MYIIEITEDTLQEMTEHVEKGLRHLGKVMQCLDELESDDSGAYGDKGRLGMREHKDWMTKEEEERRTRSYEDTPRRTRRY